jgi:hypothetical protein
LNPELFLKEIEPNENWNINQDEKCEKELMRENPMGIEKAIR